MRHSVFSVMMEDTDARRRGAGVMGLRFAEVKEITDEGYILEWLSGAVRSRSAPARAASFMAGNERGAYFPFEIDDEVVVGFIDGDLDQPVILGALWSDVDRPAPDVDTSGDNNTRSIVSRAGHELAFDDTESQGKVLLKSAGGIQILMDDAAGSLTIQLDDSTKIVLDSSGVTVNGSTINLN